jgi:hypothetical protein
MERLKLALEILGNANGMIPLTIYEWPQDLKIDYQNLENQCKRLTNEELEKVVNGEPREISEIEDSHKIIDLTDFLNRVLNGDLAEFFFWTI